MSLFTNASWNGHVDTPATVHMEVERIKEVLRENDYDNIVNDAVEWIKVRCVSPPSSGIKPEWMWPWWYQRSVYTNLLPTISAKILRGEHIEGLGVLLLNLGRCAEAEGYLCTSERYLLLALIYDLINDPEASLPTFSGAYMELVKRGLTDGHVQGIRNIVNLNPKEKLPEVLFPKSLLIANSLCRTPSDKELLLTEANHTVVSYLYDRVLSAAGNDAKGKTLEEFVEYAFSAINGFIPDLKQKDGTKQYDLICEVIGDQDTFRKEIGRHIMGEAKNTNSSPPTNVAHRLDSLLDSSGIKLGIIIAKKRSTPSMDRELTRIRNKQRHLILYLTIEEICGQLVSGNFYSLLKLRYDRAKLNLDWLKEEKRGL